MSNDSRNAKLLYVLAFLSGAAALAYEVSWTKWLSLSFGSSTLGVSATVAGFMGGMGVGAWAYHHAQARVANPLRLYAALECAIALSAVGLTLILESLPELFAVLLPSLSESGGAWSIFLRVITALGVLLLPTALIGATYPALCSVVISNSEGLDRHLGALYGWNTIGAACGGLIAGILLIPAVGLNGAVGIGVALNLAVAAAALAIDVRTLPRAADPPRVLPDPDVQLRTGLPRGVTAGILFLSGFTTLAYEIIWFRAYRPIAGTSTFAFTIVLVTFLLGLGFGALPLRRIIAFGNPIRSLSLIQIGIALTAAAGMAGLGALLEAPYGISLSVTNSTVRTLEWPIRLLLHGVTALIIMLPATLLMGLSFPLASRLYVDDPTQAGKRVGSAVLFANLGSIVGAIGAATILLPRLGSMSGTKLLIGLNLLMALVVALFDPGKKFERWRWLVPGVGAAAMLTALIPTSAIHPSNPLGAIPSRVIFEQEGDLATVRVAEGIANPTLRGMSIDGATIGVSAGWLHSTYSKQVILAHLPLALEPSLRSALQIGLGSASTLDSMTQHPTLERIDAVEINEAVVRGAAFFEESRAFDDPRVTVHVDDAIHYLLRTTSTYDMIVADGKQDIDFSGNAKVLSQEFYELALRRLSDRGLFVQWISTMNLHEDFDVIVRTAASVFPNLNVFFQPARSVFLVGSHQPLDGRAYMEHQDVPPRVMESLRHVGIGQIDWLRLGWLADREALIQAVGDGPINRWGDPVLEFFAYMAPPDSFSGIASLENIERLFEANALAISRTPSGFAPLDPDTLQAHRLTQRAYVEFAWRHPQKARTLLHQAKDLAPDDPIVANALKKILGRRARRHPTRR
jgi:predicted membrane-bound spermidine synthase